MITFYIKKILPNQNFLEKHSQLDLNNLKILHIRTAMQKLMASFSNLLRLVVYEN